MKWVWMSIAVWVTMGIGTLHAAVEDSVVRIVATIRYPNPLKPWTNGDPVEVFGSGTVIDGQRVITNAHLVLYATDVQIQPRRGGRKVDAKVEVLSPEMDLAVLSVRDGKFFERTPALQRASALPKVQDNVVVYGFPIGGTDLSVTKGVVSRIGYGGYYQQGTGLIIQVSAAINPGNSGGPALVDDQMVGVVFSRLSDQQNIGFLIPNLELDRFLEDVKDGRYDGKPTETSGTGFQRTESVQLRRSLQLDDETRGVLILPPLKPPADYPFQEFDLLTKIGPYEIDNDGNVQLPDDLRVGFFAVIPELADQGSVPVTFVRKGQILQGALSVSNQDNRLIRDYKGEKATYFIHGPLVFSPARTDAIAWYAQLRPDLNAVGSPLYARYQDRVAFPGEELVVLTSPLFNHKIAQGYSHPVGQVVASVNGTKIQNLQHLVEVLRDCADEYVTIRFAELRSEVLVFDRKDLEAATEEILEDNGIRPGRRGSEDIMKVWQQSAQK